MRSLLVALDDTPSGQSAIEFAIKTAAPHRVRLSGLAVIDKGFLIPTEPGRAGMIELKARRDAAVIAAEQRRIDLLTANFLIRCDESFVPAAAATLESDPAHAIRRAAAVHDAIVIGLESDLHGKDEDGSSATVSGLLKATARPLFVVPAGAHSRTSTDILIAYDGSIPAARTLQIFAHLGLANDVKCKVLSVNREMTEATRAANEADAYMSLFGYAPALLPIASRADPADVATQTVVDANPGLVVMGAYGHTGLKERLLGSFTTNMLANCAAPLFIYH